MSDDLKNIVVEKAVEKSTYDEFLEKLPPNDPRYVVYDFVYNVGDEGERHKILFYVWYVFFGRLSPIVALDRLSHCAVVNGC
jgi:hypothetical protein